MKKLLLLSLVSLLQLSNLAAQGNLKADYYNGINFERYVGTQYVSKIDFYWNETPPLNGVEPDNCSVLYTGRLKAPKTGIVSFHARVDDGIRVWINDTLVISNWQLNDVGISNGKIHLEADTNYDIKIKYFNAMNEAELQLYWKLPEDPDESWFRKLWQGDDPVIISSEHFIAPFIHKA